MNSHPFHYAAEYFDRGYSVIPLCGKLPPAGFRWKQYQTHRATLAQLRCWFGGENPPPFNLGIVTGCVSDLVVIDCDTHAGAEFWLAEHPKTPLIAATKRGLHFYYRSGGRELRCRTELFGRKIDVRGNGGYVVAPPSLHPQTGRAYAWQPWEHYCLEEVPAFDPAWLPPAEPLPSAASLSACRQSRAQCAIGNPTAYISRIWAVSGQGGHNATYRAAALCRDAGLSQVETMQALLAWNETNAKPPWSERELAHKVRDVFKVLLQ